ncbi:FUSC family protein [Legionella taurinensis]|uniref:FUSC family protein n=1 Tax=Legionella taurinensis TaxID=70611 RepID=A0A3A5LXQ7_9GAMM|nr:FUSC family protein [Legionella taurinensis]MDX1838640.1 FUSC family protein [Legionella taurinensis]PUT38851.1 hypothetical protein DB744_12850 [Legionella taurinensis]PUT40151.1 hypothetical protein DB746_11785 [Legionella taurinensis]PUT42457.1 hypothetical protein DB743_12270 [Legionella taurinensis]PUT44636.1 hypothetical protein DB745_13850 [Legionella taurinensis]
MELRGTTRMAWQAAIAISIAELISLTLNLERGYWTTLTAMVLTTQTWGESVKRSLERVSMTILGGVAGTMLYFLLPTESALIPVILLIFVFFTVFFFPIYHLLAVFALTGFIVFLFAMIGAWNLVLLEERILDTALGALIAVLVGCFFLPVKTDIAGLFIGHFEKMKASLSLGFLNQSPLSLPVISFPLAADFQAIRKKAIAIRYEVLFHYINRHDFGVLLTQTAICTQYVVGVLDAYQWLMNYLSREDKQRIRQVVETTQHNIETLIKQLKQEPHDAMKPPCDMIDLVTKAIEEDPTRFAHLDNQGLGYFNLMHFFTRLNTRLNDIYRLLDKSKD